MQLAKRGKVLRDPYVGPGLLMVEGQQYQFVLEGVWQSEEPPKPGVVVDVELDNNGRVHTVTVVPEAQLAREQAEAALALARQRGSRIAVVISGRLGGSVLLATVFLIVGWFFLSALSIQTPLGKLNFTFWEVLGFLNTNNIFESLLQQGQASTGPWYEFLGVAAIFGPFVHYLSKARWTLLGGFTPLLFMCVVGIVLRGTLRSVLGPHAPTDPASGDFRIISLGGGTYLSLMVSLYFAGMFIREFLVARASEARIYDKPGKLVA